MKKNQVKKNPFEVSIKLIKAFLGIATFAILFYMVVTQLVMPDERDDNPTKCRFFETQWQRVLENGEKIPVKIPSKLDAQWGEVVTITTTLPDNLVNGEYLCFFAVWQDVRIYIDGELRLDYNNAETRLLGKNSATRYLFVEIGEEDCGKQLLVEISSESKYAGNVNEWYIGDRTSIWSYFLELSGMRTIIAILLILVSSFCIGVCFVLRYVYKKEMELIYLAWTLFFCALWMLSESVFRQLFIPNISSFEYLAYWCLMIIPLTLMIYINAIQKSRYVKWYIVLMIYCVGTFVISTILQLTELVQFVSLVSIIHLGLIVVIVSIIATIIIDMVKKHISEYLFVGIGVCGMLLTTVMEMVLYYQGTSASMGAVLGIGLLFLLVMAVVKTGQDLFQSEKNKQQAIASREAQALFLANMSHEIRTPINIIIGMNEMILRENDNPAISSYSHNIENASNMLLGLVNDVLDFTKIESGQMEIVTETYSLAELLQDGVLIINARVEGKPISVQIDIDEKLPVKLYGDSIRIRQIMTNLLSNAAKYTSEGCITLKAYSESIDEESILFCFSVIDTGMGIKKEDLPTIFDSFKRMDLRKNRNIQGTGLGLNIVKQLVEQMNGCIEVESEYEKGSVFTVKIPQKVIDKAPIGNLETANREKRVREETEQKIFTAPEANVLVVDDNQMNLTIMRGLLKRTKMKVDFATSGKQCLHITRKKKYDIILMDHMMPDLDGVETLQIIRNEEENLNKDGIIIVLTANAIAGCREMYLDYGFNDYIAKPIEPKKLEELLRDYLPKELIIME